MRFVMCCACCHPLILSALKSRVIPHRAGQADLAQTGAEYLHLYGMPNFFFHMSMGYAALRASGLPLGKGYFDGYHRYPTDIPTPGV